MGKSEAAFHCVFSHAVIQSTAVNDIFKMFFPSL